MKASVCVYSWLWSDIFTRLRPLTQYHRVYEPLLLQLVATPRYILFSKFARRLPCADYDRIIFDKNVACYVFFQVARSFQTSRITPMSGIWKSLRWYDMSLTDVSSVMIISSYKVSQALLQTSNLCVRVQVGRNSTI
jgi:hypothetical protein